MNINMPRASSVLAAAVVAVALVLLIGLPAQAAFPGKNGKIAFTRVLEPPDAEIFTMNADGSGQRAITKNTTQDGSPSWSPDSTEVAFSGFFSESGSDIFAVNARGTGQRTVLKAPPSDSDPDRSSDGKISFVRGGEGGGEFASEDIFMVNADGTALKRLTNSPEPEFDPAFSPDGRKVAFVDLGNAGGDVYVMNADGTGRVNLTNSSTAQESSPAFSPDGKQIAFSVIFTDGNPDTGEPGGEAFDIYVINTDGTGLKRLTSSSGNFDDHPNWSPDGRKISFTRNGDIYAMSSNGTAQRRLLAREPGAFLSHPDWSPDGKKIAFAKSFHENFEIFSASPGGLETQNLTKNPAFDVSPAWSADGKRIAFERSVNSGPDLFVMNANGSRPRNLTNTSRFFESDPAWSPNGEIVFAKGRSEIDTDLYIMNANGTGIKQITRGPSADLEPAWSPDGKKIAFVKMSGGGEAGVADIYVMNADGSGQKNLTRTSTQAGRLKDEFSPDWSPDGKRIAFTLITDGFISEIAVMNADGSVQKKLTRGGLANFDSDPAFSPDGKRIAFSRNGGIFTSNTNGTAIKKVTRSVGGFDSAPSWQPLPASAATLSARCKIPVILGSKALRVLVDERACNLGAVIKARVTRPLKDAGLPRLVWLESDEPSRDVT